MVASSMTFPFSPLPLKIIRRNFTISGQVAYNPFAIKRECVITSGRADTKIKERRLESLPIIGPHPGLVHVLGNVLVQLEMALAHPDDVQHLLLHVLNERN